MKTCPVCDSDFPDHNSFCPTDGAVLIVSHVLSAGSLVRGKYRIVRKIGQGGMGVVYLAEHILLGGQAALKFLAGDLGKDPRFIQRFRLEARAAYKLRHPNIVEVTDLDQAEDGSLFIAMEFIDGPNLRTVLEQSKGGLAIPRALQLARGIASGVAAAHTQGTVHRDIKPENILLARAADGQERPKVLDFGIVAMAESANRTSLTRGLLLTPEYAAPEQWLEMAAKEMDGRTDIYALGGVLYEMLTGRTPFQATNTSGWMRQHLEATPQPPSSLCAEISSYPGLDALVLRMLSRERDERPANAGEVVADLCRIGGEPDLPSQAARMETILDSHLSTARDKVSANEQIPDQAIQTSQSASKLDRAEKQKIKLRYRIAAFRQRTGPRRTVFIFASVLALYLILGLVIGLSPLFWGFYWGVCGMTLLIVAAWVRVGFKTWWAKLMLAIVGIFPAFFFVVLCVPAVVSLMALSGTPGALERLAEGYSVNDNGLTKNPAKAASLFRRACDGGNLYACDRAGDYYKNGDGVTQDFTQSVAFYSKACDGQYVTACDDLDTLGDSYLRGADGATQSDSTGTALVSKACDGGSAWGCEHLGDSYEGGKGIAKDPAKAAAAYDKACSMGNDWGCYSEGDLYRNGAMPQDMSKAKDLLTKACNMNNQFACDQLKKLDQPVPASDTPLTFAPGDTDTNNSATPPSTNP